MRSYFILFSRFLSLKGKKIMYLLHILNTLKTFVDDFIGSRANNTHTVTQRRIHLSDPSIKIWPKISNTTFIDSISHFLCGINLFLTILSTKAKKVIFGVWANQFLKLRKKKVKGFLESETEEFKQILVGIMDTSESRNRKAISVEKFDLEVPETAHQISSGSFLILYLWNLYFIAHIVFFLFVLCCFWVNRLVVYCVISSFFWRKVT